MFIKMDQIVFDNAWGDSTWLDIKPSFMIIIKIAENIR